MVRNIPPRQFIKARDCCKLAIAMRLLVCGFTITWMLLPITSNSVLAKEPSKNVVVKKNSAKKEKVILPKKWQPASPSRKWKYIVLHHTATKSGNVKTIDAAHRQRKTASGKNWQGIGYHFLIGNGNKMTDGAVEPTFRWKKQKSGAHAGNNEYNRFGIGVCLVGNFEESKPTKRQLKAVKELVQRLAKTYQISPKSIVGHRDVRATKCPGKNFPLKEIRKSVDRVKVKSLLKIRKKKPQRTPRAPRNNSRQKLSTE